jgi:hypothetical protein
MTAAPGMRSSAAPTGAAYPYAGGPTRTGPARTKESALKKILTAGFIAAGLLSFIPTSANADPCVTVDASTSPPVHSETCIGDDDSTGAAGFTCGFGSSDDPTGTVANPGTQVGEVDGGPIAVADLPTVSDSTPPVVTFDVGGNPASGTITCALQVGGTGVYTDPDAVSAAASGTVVVYLPPTLISYQAGLTDPVWSCTTWTLTSGSGETDTLYLDDATGEFSTDPATATCALATSQQIPPQEVCDAAPPACGDIPPGVKP